MEKWIEIEGYPNYFVSNKGFVKTVDRLVFKKNGTFQKVKGRTLKLKKGKLGYLRVPMVDENGKQKLFLIHRIVLIGFKGLNKFKNQVNHINGIKSDNRLENLEWSTCSENTKHAYRIGLKSQKGENHAQSRLKKEDIIQIRNMVNLGFKQKEIALKFGIKRSYVSEIKNKRVWSHV